MKPRFFKNLSPVDSGFYLVLVAGTLVAMLAILGLAIDVAKLQNMKLRVQRAVDASSIAATYLLEDQPRSVIQSTAERILNDNLSMAGILPSEISSLSVTLLPADSSARTVKVSASVSLNVSMLRVFPGFAAQTIVGASAESGDKRVATVLVLDISGSMNDTVPCGSLPSAPPTCTKLDFVKAAAIRFVNLFHFQDRLAVVTFSDAATVLYPMTRNPDKTAIATAINLLHPQNNTNTYDALVKARAQMSSSVNSDLGLSDSRSIVLVTDGAPYADDNYSQPSVPVPPVPANCLTSGSNEFRFRRMRYVAAVAQADMARTAGTTIFAIGLGPKGLLSSEPCPTHSTADNPWTKYSQLDPYQCAQLDDIVKNFFLARLTNDQSAMAGDPSASPAITATPDFPTTCVPSKAAIDNIKEGKFYQTDDVNDLGPLLAAIGKHINAILKK